MRASLSLAQENRHWLIALALCWVIDIIGVPWLDPYIYTVIIYSGINIILAVGLNLVNGFTGQFSIGHAGFMAVGAYTSAFLSMQLKSAFPVMMSSPFFQVIAFLAIVFIGGVCASLIGYLVGLPSLRLKGDYLAIVTLGFGEIIRVLLLNIDSTGGARGMPNIPPLTRFGWVYSFVVITVFTVWRVMRSAYGREFLAVREDEIAAENMGVHTTRAKVRAFVIGAFFAGIAGSLFAHQLMYLNPSIFDFNRSFEVVIMVVLGGMGSISGSVIAAAFLTILKEALRPLQEWTHLDFRMIFYSLLLIILMLTRPHGLFGSREIFDLFSKKRNETNE